MRARSSLRWRHRLARRQKLVYVGNLPLPSQSRDSSRSLQSAEHVEQLGSLPNFREWTRTASYGEIGRAQIAQAEACGIEPETDMNPILLKPHSDMGSQVVVNGRVWQDLERVRLLRALPCFAAERARRL